MTAREGFDIEKEATLIVDTLTSPHSEGSRQLSIGYVEKTLRRCQDAAYEKAIKSAETWLAFYESMQKKSAPGEKDWMYQMFAAEDILNELRTLKTPEVGK